MRSLRVSLVCLILVGITVCNGQSETVPATITEEISTVPVTTPNSTVTPTTSTTTTSTPPPTTKPTTPATTTSTTPEPSTTTVAPSTTTVAPSPKPVPTPEMGNWSFTDSKNNQTCVIAQMAVQFNLSYFNVSDKPVSVQYNLPKDAVIKSGSCGNVSNFIELSWAMDKQSNNYSSLKIDFALNATEHDFAFVGMLLKLTVVGDDFPNAKLGQQLVLSNNQTLFKTPLDMSYHCSKAQVLNLTSAVSGLGQPMVTITKLQLEAFHTKHNNKFSIAKDCEAIDTPDIVPIAVGCALVTLIIIMLIAYLVGRNSANSQGYLSM